MSSLEQTQKKRIGELVALSREFGTEEYVIAGGGNTSVKIDGELWVKSSGVALGDADESSFVRLDRSLLDEVLETEYPDAKAERELLVKRGLMRSMMMPDVHGRPSVEASLHSLIDYTYVVHTHAWKVNALTCSKDGMKILAQKFGTRALALPYSDPGYTLAMQLRRELGKPAYKQGQPPIIFLQNHGVFVGADSPAGIRKLMREVMSTCASLVPAVPPADKKTESSSSDIHRVITAIRSALSRETRKTTFVLNDKLTRRYCASRETFKPLLLPFTPDQIVYCRSHPLWVKAGAEAQRTIGNFRGALDTYRQKHAMDPAVVAIEGFGIVAVGNSYSQAVTVAKVFGDAIKVAHGSGKSGGPRAMTTSAREFIESWEVEKYRLAVAGAGMSADRTAVVTGGAQGFGEGIVRQFFSDGLNVVIADLNEKRGAALAAELMSSGKPRNGAIFVKTNVTDEKSVANLLEQTVFAFGGCDVFISNAGVLKAGGLDEIDAGDFDFMTSVNYKGYFICAKYAAQVMKEQRTYAPHMMTDIIQVNSKSGLEGSKNNFTYAGGKFGGIGLTQSFALELIQDGIKVNSICPGNFLDGPLWADPRKGLFVQYLKAGKVEGAKTVEDVRRAYEKKVPAARGCTVSDVMRAIYYVIDQEYETGQAVPVTGGQVMLN